MSAAAAGGVGGTITLDAATPSVVAITLDAATPSVVATVPPPAGSAALTLLVASDPSLRSAAVRISRLASAP